MHPKCIFRFIISQKNRFVYTLITKNHLFGIKISRIFNVTTDYLLDVERERVVDVSELSEYDVCVVNAVIEALKLKNKN